MKWDIPLIDNRIVGVELIINSDGGYIFNFSALKKEHSKILTENSGSGITEQKQLYSFIDKSRPVLLSINGRGIIHKKIPKTENEGYESLLTKVLPNSNLNDFYIQTFQLDPSNCLASVIRKNVAEQIINSFIGEGFKIVGCTLGPFSVQSVLPLLFSNNESFELKFSGHELTINNGNISNYTPLSIEAPDKLIGQNDFNINSSQLISFATAFAYYNPVSQLSSNISSISETLDEFKNEVKFKKAGIITLSVFFIILLLNFICFGILTDKVKSKSTQVLVSSSALNMIDTMRAQVNDRTHFLSNSGLSEPSRTSFYADQIAQDLPPEIILTGINIQPLKKDDDEKKKMQFENKKIFITGKAQHALNVNEWTKTLRKMDWLESLVPLNYKQKEENAPGEFIIEIKLK